ncbi:hypothetical protein QLX08_003840 [Tetragonisca angustula]|uniref:TIL domain-containing protein n=1 Tax=Tetragonisca angustula TaxID=166442 RepID=A0AAW1A4X1_9HYME
MQRYLVASLLAFVFISVCSFTNASSCSKNEKMNICGTLCEATCKEPNPELCPAIMCTKITSGCRCMEGTLRNQRNNKCVLPKDC